MNTRLLRKLKFIDGVEGTSMMPLLYPKDGIFFQPVAFNKLKVEDIIIFTLKDKLVTHRVVFKADKYIIAKGDNNPDSDGRIYPNQIIGRVYKIKRNGKIFNLDDLYLIQSTVYFGEIVRIKKAFAREKIDLLFLKGLPLYLYFEKSHPKRFYFDCDILIAKSFFPKAKKIITKNGFRKLDLSLFQGRKASTEEMIEISFYKKLNGIFVIFDVHFRPNISVKQIGPLESIYPLGLQDKLTSNMLKTKREVLINKEVFPILEVNYLIIFLAVHFCLHNFRGAFRLELLDKIIRRSGLKANAWEKLARKIAEYRLQNFVYYAFVLAKKYYQTPVPNRFFKIIKPSGIIPRLLGLEQTNIFDDQPRIKAGVTRFLLFFLLSPNNFIKKFMVFTNLEVWYFIFMILKRKIIPPRRQNVVRVDQPF